MADDKPFKCDQCDYSAKTQGAITQHVNKEHGDDPLAKLRAGIPGAPRPGGAFSTKKLEARPSGIPSVDFALGIGGVPGGTIIEVFGPPASGKTFTALTFSAYAQSQGMKAGFMDAERALTETFLKLIPNLDADALEYGHPPDASEMERPTADQKKLWDGSGESALEASRRWIQSGEFGVWTVDSVHACTPRQMLGKPINDPQAQAALARLFNQALQVMELEISKTNTLGVFINHVKHKPGVSFGRDWTKPAGSAFDYYASAQLHVTAAKPIYRHGDKRRMGHTVRVRVHKSKVAAPHVSAEYDLYYVAGKTQADENRPSRVIEHPGVDITSAWFSVLKEADYMHWVGQSYWNKETAEKIGTEAEIREMLEDEGSDLYKAAHAIVYPEQYRRAAA